MRIEFRKCVSFWSDEFQREKKDDRERERKGVSRGFSLIESASGERNRNRSHADLYGGPFTWKAGKFRRWEIDFSAGARKKWQTGKGEKSLSDLAGVSNLSLLGSMCSNFRRFVYFPFIPGREIRSTWIVRRRRERNDTVYLRYEKWSSFSSGHWIRIVCWNFLLIFSVDLPIFCRSFLWIEASRFTGKNFNSQAEWTQLFYFQFYLFLSI